MVGKFLSGAVLYVLMCSSVWTAENLSSFASPNSLTSDDILKSKVYHEVPFDEIEDLNSRIIRPRYCQKPAKCEKLQYTTCFGVRLPYASTSLSLVPGVTNQDDVQVN